MTRESHQKLGLVAALLAALLLAGGCAGYRVEVVDVPRVAPFGEEPGLGRVCVLRPGAFGAVAQAVHLDNGVLVGATQGGRVFFCYLAEPGGHRIVARTDNDAELDVTVAAGATTFVRYDLGVGPDILSPLDEAEARALLPRLDAVASSPASRDVAAPATDPVPAR